MYKIVLLLLLISNNIFAQLGQKFWFVAPEVSLGHSDQPLVFRITTSDQPANITISMPANPGFSTISQTIPSHTQRTFEVNKDIVENRPSNTILNKGIYIESNTDITAYYEVIANGLNPDKFTLKGNNALGTEFYIPSQNIYVNQTLNPIADEKTDIVATEDNTTITITPTVDIVGHKADVNFSITLNRGQTFSLENKDISRNSSMAGTYITSNKPIAITISDDSVDDIEGSQGPYDLIGDQLIPTSVIGTEYIAVNTSNDSRTVNKVFILATEDDTHVWLNNDITSIIQLNKGDTKDFDITNNAIYIKSTKPVYAYQLASFWNRFGNELGSAILPNITCTGSQWVSITRTFTDKFHIQLLTKKKNLDGFILTDNNSNRLNYLDNANWIVVAGTNNSNDDDTWYSASIPLNISTGVPYILENTKGLFHMSILDENVGSVSYGYFSSYGTLIVQGLTEECLGNSVVLSTDEPMKSYQWHSDKTGNTILSTEPTLSVNESGKYWVTAEVNFGGCKVTDTIDVNFFLPHVDLGPDTSMCVNEIVTIENLYKNEGQYLWNDNSTADTFDVTTAPNSSDEIWLQITDSRGCTNKDTIVVSSLPQPALDLSNVTNVCIGDTIFNNTVCNRYQWSVNGVSDPADTLSYIVVLQSGTYTLTGWNIEGCSVTESLNITMHNLPSINLNDVIECPDETELFSGPVGMASYQWMNNSNTPQITINQPDTVWLEITDNNGCVNRDSAIYQWYKKTIFDIISNDTSVCINSDITLNADNGLSNYSWWFNKNGTPINLNNNTSSYSITNSSTNDEGSYIVFADDINGCALSDTLTLHVINVPPLSLGSDHAICEGDTIQIISNQGYITYTWTKTGDPGFSSTDPFILVATPGKYLLSAEMANGCINNDSITVTTLGAPKVILDNDFTVCPNTNFTLGINSFQPSSNGGAIQSIKWNTGETSAPITKQDSGTYTILVFDNNKCFDYDTITVSWYNIPEWELDTDTAICDNTSLVLQSPLSTPTQANSYQWTKVPGNSGPTDNDWTVNTPGDYILTINDLNDCISIDTTTVSLLNSPSLDLGPDRAICNGDTIELTAGDTFEQYEWNNNPTNNSPSFPITTSGDISLTVWNIEGCSDTDIVSVIVNPIPLIDLGSDLETCAGEEVILTAPAGMDSYYWNTRDTTQSITVYKGTYNVSITDINGCSNSDTITYIWRPVPQIELGNDTAICPVDIIELDAGNGYATYQWQNGAVTQTIIANIVDTVNMVKVSNQYNCYSFDTKMVRLLPTPDYELSPDTFICSNDSLLLDAGQGYVMYNWFDNTTDEFTYISTEGEYWVKVFDGCFWMSDTMSLVVQPTPIITTIDTSVYSQIVIYPQGGTEPYLYALNDDPFQDENIYQKLPNGTYIIYVEDANRCMAQDTVSLSGTGEVEVPNFFTPNGDGINDRWEIEGIDKYPESIIKIYNRYGKLLIKYTASEQGWNGEYLGKPVPSDDYWFVIHLIPTDKIIKGHITIKR